MIYTNLALKPEYFSDTIKLIESAFAYSQEHHFEIDFFPLMRKENHHNCHIVIHDDKVIAHVGVLEKNLSLNEHIFPIIMYGGIAVDEKLRGKGIFKELFLRVLSMHSDTCLHMLWSDQLDLYKKFGFFPAIEQVEYNQSLEDAELFAPSKLSQLNDNEIKQLKRLYDGQNDIRINRSLEDWEILKGITSSDLYIKREKEEITNYFFTNKGEDLNGVILEVGNFSDLHEIIRYGITWAPKNFLTEFENDILFASVLKIGRKELFFDFIHQYTKHRINIQKLNDTDVIFNFAEKQFNMDIENFLTGVFGPNQFEELTDCPPFYISGLDSI